MRHAEVEQDDVGLRGRHGGHHAQAVGGLADDLGLAVLLQDVTHQRAEFRDVIA